MADVLFPLRSNSQALVAGAGVASVRRRLKTASILYDRILLEGGSVHIMAGPTGGLTTASSFQVEHLRSRWDSASARHKAKGHQFSLSVATDTTPGVPPSVPYGPVVRSEATISWDVSLEPFFGELPRGCDWIGFASLRKPGAVDEHRVKDWQWRDSRNNRLLEAIPVGFVRSRVINDANDDLGVGLANNAAVSADALHQTVMLKRFEDDSGWQFSGFALGLVLPEVTGKTWDEVSAYRRHKAIDYYRKTLQEVETEALSVSNEELGAAVRRLYTTRLSKAVGKIEGMGTVLKRTPGYLLVGYASSFVTAGVTGPMNHVAGAALGTALGAVVDYRAVAQKRRERGWVALDLQIRGA